MNGNVIHNSINTVRSSNSELLKTRVAYSAGSLMSAAHPHVLVQGLYKLVARQDISQTGARGTAQRGATLVDIHERDHIRLDPPAPSPPR